MLSFSRWRHLAIVLLVVALALAGSFGTANAATGTGGNAALEQGLTRLQARFAQLTQQLDAADAFAAQLDGQLATMRSRNQDTRRLELSLAGFRNRLKVVRSVWSSTQADLARRGGFDAAGRVSNSDQAKATLYRIGTSLGRITNLLADANAIVRRDFASNGQQPAPAPNPGGGTGGNTGGNTGGSTSGNATLEQGLVKLQTRFAQLTQQLDAADAFAAQLDGQLADMRSRNQDTRRLELSLAGFRNRLKVVRSVWSSTQADLARRGGFDAAGRVSNSDQAKATLYRIGTSLGRITNLLADANAIVRRDFASNGQQPAPAPNPGGGNTGGNTGGSTSGNATLEQGLVKLQTRFAQLTQQLNAADAYAVTVEAQLADMRSRNQDTRRLELSLAGFRNRLRIIRGVWSGTQADLARRGGFDTAGRVSNSDQAKATLNRIGKNLGRITSLVDDAYSVIRREIPKTEKKGR